MIIFENDDQEITLWEDIPCTVYFENPKAQTSTNFGFDWVHLSKSGEIENHHGLGSSQATHYLNITGKEYSAIDASKYEDTLLKIFPLATTLVGDDLRVPTAYLSVMENGASQDINIDMHIKSKDKISKKSLATVYFGIPEKIEMIFSKTHSINSTTHDKSLNLESNQINFTLRIKPVERDETMELMVYRSDTKDYPIGRLVIERFSRITIPVYIWPMVDCSGGKANAQIAAEVNKLVLATGKLQKLRTKLDEIYHQAGIQLEPIYPAAPDDNPGAKSGYLTFDITSSTFKDFIRTDNNDIKFAEAPNFMKLINKIIKENNTVHKDFNIHGSFDNAPGSCINVIILDRDASRPASNGATEFLRGLGNVGGGYNVMIFAGALELYGIYAHEIGHYFGLLHSFEDGDSLTPLKDSMVSINQYKAGRVSTWIYNPTAFGDRIELWNEYLTNNPEEAALHDESRDGKIEVEARFYDTLDASFKEPIPDYHSDDITHYNRLLSFGEKVLYEKEKTTNVMDYNEKHEYLFKWQWDMVRYTAKKLGH